MSVSVEESLQKIYNEIFPSPEDCLSYNEDADKIRISLMEKMKECDSSFKEAFDGLSLVENYMDLWKTSLPDEFNIYVKLKLPMSVISLEKWYNIDSSKKFIFLNTTGEHRIIHHKRICRQCLQEWIRNLLMIVISDGLRLSFDERTYMIEYPKNGRWYGIAHTILAKETTPGKREFSFNLVPAFEFKKCGWLLNEFGPWFAIPYAGNNNNNYSHPSDFSFIHCAPHREEKIFYGDQIFLKSFRLMKALCTTMKLKWLTSYMLKSVYIELKRNYDLISCNKSLEKILFEALDLLKKHVNDKSSYLFFYKGIHDMEFVSNLNIETLEYILVTFRQWKEFKFISYDIVARFFNPDIFAQNRCKDCLELCNLNR